MTNAQRGPTVTVQRPAASTAATPSHKEKSAAPQLTRAEASALRRSAPLSAAQFKELRRLAAQGVSPLRHL
jgi:hypothetical protein